MTAHKSPIRILPATGMASLLVRRKARLAGAESAVRPILEAVRARGDKALIEYARQFDAFDRKSVAVPEVDLRRACAGLAPDFRNALSAAAGHIRAFAELQLPGEWLREVRPGMQLGQVVRPLDTIAAYIPAGRYPLFSTLMMTVIPAQVAGVPDICVACPRPVPEILGVAYLLGVRRVFQMGGAQAIAAFAFGTRTVPRADRIVGPGSIYVAAAKKLLAGEVGIDFVAGPTGSDHIRRWRSAPARRRHARQAEHDVNAYAILSATSEAARERCRQPDPTPTCGPAHRRRRA